MSSTLARMQLKVKPEQKRDIQRAAELIDENLTEFTIKAAYERAKQIIKQNENIMLTDIERDKFLALLENPPEPNTKLKEAMKKFLAKK